MSDLEQARAAKEHLAAELSGRSDVVGIGLTRSGSGYCVKVNVREPAAAEGLPRSMDGVEVRITETGPIQAQG